MFGLSKLADKDFIVGYVLPILVGGAAFIGLFHDVDPVKGMAEKVLEGGSFTGITTVALAVWTLATVLMVLNHQILRCFEGLQGPLNRASGTERQRSNLAARTATLAALYRTAYPGACPAAVPAAGQVRTTAAPAAMAPAATAMLLLEISLSGMIVLLGLVLKANRDGRAVARWRRRIRVRYERRRAILDDAILGVGVPDAPPGAPGRGYPLALSRRLREFPLEHQLLPTRFGNAVRAFETYPDRVYALDGLTVWTRLVAVVPASYAAIVNEARSEMTLWVNASLLAMMFSVAALGRAVERAACHGDGGLQISETVLAIGFAWLAYRLATERAVAWGETVRAAYDLYLPALAKQLGYALPAERDGEGGRSAFWADVSAMFLMERVFDPRKWPSAAEHGERNPADDGSKDDASKDDASKDEEPEDAREDEKPGDEEPDDGEPKDGRIEG